MNTVNQHPITIDTYRSMVKKASTDWRFTTYDQVKNLESFVVWRHDCDMSLNRAKLFSILDAEVGIKATFFINLHSTFYNAFELSQTKIVREIVGSGHRIGLHFDYDYLEKTNKVHDFDEVLIREAQLLEQISESSVDVFSFHNPNAETARFTEHEYAGLVNCYSSWMRENVRYSSDSNGYWRYEPIPDVLQDKSIERLQILTHPEWWLEKTATPRDRVLRCAYGRATKTIAEYDSTFEGSLDRDNLKPSSENSNDYDRASKIL